ncbi:hypothetical protein CBR_g40257 [Chara braunii]|uniref:Integrase zinc-binding domain-containing protein n=1 Tax=Chara braunii TaxID=69332 RepID=A0A388K1T0_CHABU|nr:hypothetical protein CBR_g40257 [Chara braunii]|eukprot:GBG64012.1 hypothetical protein CBR_g40257 [Chara braunii]
MFDFQLEHILGNKNRADGLSRIEWEKPGEAKEEAPPVDGFLEEDDMQLHVNAWALRIDNNEARDGKPMWFAPTTFMKDGRLVLKPFVEEDPWGERNGEWMAELALAESYRLTDEPVPIEAGTGQVDRHLLTVGRVHYLVNSLLQVRTGEERGTVKADEIVLGDEPEFDEEMEGEEFEQGEISEDFREEEYDGFHLEMGLLLSGDKREREVGEKTLRMRDHYVVRGDHLFIRDERGRPRRVNYGRNRQIDVIATFHDGPVGGHRGFAATLKKVTEVYFWKNMYGMVRKYCESCVSCKVRLPIRYKEPLHPRYIKDVGAVVHLDLLAMPPGLGVYNYIFDARDNLTGFVDGKTIRTKTGAEGVGTPTMLLRVTGVGECQLKIEEITTDCLGWMTFKTEMRAGYGDLRRDENKDDIIFNGTNVEDFEDNIALYAEKKGWKEEEKLEQKQPAFGPSSPPTPRPPIDVDALYFLEYKDGVRTKREFEISPAQVVDLGEWEDLYNQRSLDPVLVEGIKEAMRLAIENKEQSYELPTLKLAPLRLDKPTIGTKAQRLRLEDWRDDLAGQYYYYAVCGQHNAAAARSLLGSVVTRKYNFEWWSARMVYFSEYDFEGHDKSPDADWSQKCPFLNIRFTIFKKFESRGLDTELWDDSRKYVIDSSLFKDCPPYMGCDADQSIQATEKLAGHKKLSVDWRNKVLSVLTGSRLKSREIALAEGIVHIKWKDTGDVTSIASFDNDPLEADIRSAEVKEAVVATKSHTFVLDLCEPVDLKLWKSQAFDSLDSQLQMWCPSHWTLVVFVSRQQNLSFLTSMNHLSFVKLLEGKWVRRNHQKKSFPVGNNLYTEDDRMYILFKGDELRTNTSIVYEGKLVAGNAAAVRLPQKVTQMDVSDIPFNPCDWSHTSPARRGSVYGDMERNPAQFVNLLESINKKGEGVVFLGKPHARSVWELLKAGRHVIAMEGNADLLQFAIDLVKSEVNSGAHNCEFMVVNGTRAHTWNNKTDIWFKLIARKRNKIYDFLLLQTRPKKDTDAEYVRRKDHMFTLLDNYHGASRMNGKTFLERLQSLYFVESEKELTFDSYSSLISTEDEETTGIEFDANVNEEGSDTESLNLQYYPHPAQHATGLSLEGPSTSPTSLVSPMVKQAPDTTPMKLLERLQALASDHRTLRPGSDIPPDHLSWKNDNIHFLPEPQSHSPEVDWGHDMIWHPGVIQPAIRKGDWIMDVAVLGGGWMPLPRGSKSNFLDVSRIAVLQKVRAENDSFAPNDVSVISTAGRLFNELRDKRWLELTEDYYDLDTIPSKGRVDWKIPPPGGTHEDGEVRRDPNFFRQGGPTRDCGAGGRGCVRGARRAFVGIRHGFGRSGWIARDGGRVMDEEKEGEEGDKGEEWEEGGDEGEEEEEEGEEGGETELGELFGGKEGGKGEVGTGDDGRTFRDDDSGSGESSDGFRQLYGEHREEDDDDDDTTQVVTSLSAERDDYEGQAMTSVVDLQHRFNEARVAVSLSKPSVCIDVEEVIDGILGDHHMSAQPSSTPDVDDPRNIKPSATSAVAFSPPNSPILPPTIARGGEVRAMTPGTGWGGFTAVTAIGSLRVLDDIKRGLVPPNTVLSTLDDGLDHRYKEGRMAQWLASPTYSDGPEMPIDVKGGVSVVMPEEGTWTDLEPAYQTVMLAESDAFLWIETMWSKVTLTRITSCLLDLEFRGTVEARGWIYLSKERETAMVVELALGKLLYKLSREAEWEVVWAVCQRVEMTMESIDVRVELGDRENVQKPYRALRGWTPRRVEGGVEMVLPTRNEWRGAACDWVRVDMVPTMFFLWVERVWDPVRENEAWDEIAEGNVEALGTVCLSKNGWYMFCTHVAAGRDPMWTLEDAEWLTWAMGQDFANEGWDEVGSRVMMGGWEDLRLPYQLVQVRVPHFVADWFGGYKHIRAVAESMDEVEIGFAWLSDAYYEASLRFGPFHGDQAEEVVEILKELKDYRLEVGEEVEEAILQLVEDTVYLVVELEWRARGEFGGTNLELPGRVRATGSLYLSDAGWRTFGVALADGGDPVRMFDGAWQVTWRDGFAFANPDRDNMTATVRVVEVGTSILPYENVRMVLPPFLLERMRGVERAEMAVIALGRLSFGNMTIYREYYRSFLELGPLDEEQEYEVLNILQAVVGTRPGIPTVTEEVVWEIARCEIGCGLTYVDDIRRLFEGEEE